MNRKPVPRLPHSWSIEDWPAEVFPGSPGRARYLTRTHRTELLREGAIARVGRELVILGERYSRWLEKQTTAVVGFEIAPNKPRPESASTATPAA